MRPPICLGLTPTSLLRFPRRVNSPRLDNGRDMLPVMKIYRGSRSDDNQEAIVEVDEDGVVHRLVPRPDIEGVQKPTGFAWGYGGSGPKQLAIALLAEA